MARRETARQAAEYLRQHYRPGAGIVFPFGDLAGVLRQAGIPLRDGLHEGNLAAFDAALGRPAFFLREGWVLAYSGDPVATAVLRANRESVHYRLRKQIIVKGAPVVEIYRRE